MGHSTKGQSGKMEKNKEQVVYIAKKSPRRNPHLIEKEIRDKAKRIKNGIQSQKDEFMLFGTF
jgi:hypothetical protein